MRKAEHIKLEFKTGNAAFDDLPATEIARILHDFAMKIERGDFDLDKGGGQPMGTLRDINGNCVGTWSIRSVR